MSNKPNYALIVDGVKWEVWKSISVRRSLERMGGEFRVELSRKPEEGFLSSTMKAGLPVQVEIDGATVLDGYIDIVAHQYDATSSSIMVTGRDKTGDLIDCAAATDGPFEFRNMKLDKVISQIIKPFGIKLTVDADIGAAFVRLAIQPGETAYEFIERACRYRAVLAVSDGIGGLVIVKPAQVRSAGVLKYGENIKKGSVSLDWSSRFSLYILKGQQEGADESSAEEVSTPEGRATDELVTRYRPTVITAESQGYNQSLKERAGWQRNVSRGRSISASYTVQGWYEDTEAKSLWRPNTLVPVSDAARGMVRDMLIVSIELSYGAGGTEATLDLALPEAYELVAEIEPSSDDVLGSA